MALAPFLASLALALAVAPTARQDLPELAREPGPRTEYFVLEMPEPARKPGAPAVRTVGTVCLRRRALASGFQLEGEWTFDRSDEEGGGERVLHVEQLGQDGSRLIWREWGPSRARSLTVDRDAGRKGLAWIDTGRGASIRDSLAASEGVWFPLELVERLRPSGPVPAACVRLDPLSRRLERVELKRTKLAPASAEDADRAFDLVRADGTIAGRFELAGRELRAFRAQDGDLVARRVGEEEYRSRIRPAVAVKRP